MKYLLFLFTSIILFNASADAQKKQHKIVFDISTADTAAYSLVIRQVNNVLKVAPSTKIEVVFYGKAVYALVKDKTTVKEKIDDLVNNKHVVIAACNNSLIRFNLTKDDLILSAIVVPVAILELTDKQEKGWSYIKAVY
jgi:hypothetical protein